MEKGWKWLKLLYFYHIYITKRNIALYKSVSIKKKYLGNELGDVCHELVDIMIHQQVQVDSLPKHELVDIMIHHQVQIDSLP